MCGKGKEDKSSLRQFPRVPASLMSLKQHVGLPFTGGRLVLSSRSGESASAGWLRRSRTGRCSHAPLFSCGSDGSVLTGSWPLTTRQSSSWSIAYRSCQTLCIGCNFMSISLLRRECTWTTKCESLLDDPAFRSASVERHYQLFSPPNESARHRHPASDSPPSYRVVVDGAILHLDTGGPEALLQLALAFDEACGGCAALLRAENLAPLLDSQTNGSLSPHPSIAPRLMAEYPAAARLPHVGYSELACGDLIVLPESKVCAPPTIPSPASGPSRALCAP
jgi:hypothetical protein